MNHFRFGYLVTIVATALLAIAAHASLPLLKKQGSASQLIVKGSPLLILGGELGNSSASSPQYMAQHWQRLRQMHLNTVLAPVYWELIEPVEGQFDWTSVDSMIKSARANDLKLVLLWFGAWKNSMSTYVPSWIKRDQRRFPRVQLSNGQSAEILSAFSTRTRDVDTSAFAALLSHLKQVDEKLNTVVMIQVENEIGMLPVAREFGDTANVAFEGNVPQALIQKLNSPDAADSFIHQLWKEHGAQQSGRWTTLFGEGVAAEEVFTAWHYSTFVEALVKAGKAIYPLPMYVNAALNRTGKLPGEYPSGGPLPHLLEVWKAGAPSLDFLSPDIYFTNFVDLASHYKRNDNPLFIPEANNAGKAEVPANAFYAFGKLDAIGFGPFSIESIDNSQPNLLADAYTVLEQLSPAILANQGLARMSGFKPRVLEDGTVIDAPVTETIGSYSFTVSFVDTQSPKTNQDIASHGGIVIQTGPEDYLIAGQGIIVAFKSTDANVSNAGIDYAWEGFFDSHGKWINGRRLNGDQTHQGRHIRLEPGKFQIQKVRLYKYR